MNPAALGLNMVEPEIITPENLFGEELSFQFYELTSPSQLQSAWHTERGRIRVIFVDESKIQNLQIVAPGEIPRCTNSADENATDEGMEIDFKRNKYLIAKETIENQDELKTMVDSWFIMSSYNESVQMPAHCTLVHRKNRKKIWMCKREYKCLIMSKKHDLLLNINLISPSLYGPECNVFVLAKRI